MTGFNCTNVYATYAAVFTDMDVALSDGNLVGSFTAVSDYDVDVEMDFQIQCPTMDNNATSISLCNQTYVSGVACGSAGTTNVDLSDLVENYSHKQIEEGLIVCAIRVSAITGDVCLKTSAVNSMYQGAVATGQTAGAVVAAVATVGMAVYAVKRMRRHRRTDGCGVCTGHGGTLTDGCGVCTGGDEYQDHYHGGTLTAGCGVCTGGVENENQDHYHGGILF